MPKILWRVTLALYFAFKLFQDILGIGGISGDVRWWAGMLDGSWLDPDNSYWAARVFRVGSYLLTLVTAVAFYEVWIRPWLVPWLRPRLFKFLCWWTGVRDLACRPRFKLYEAACLLQREDPPATYQGFSRKNLSPESKKVYDSLVTAIWDDDLGSDLAFEAGRLEAVEPSQLHELEIDRATLREYLSSKEGPIPEFLNERFDELAGEKEGE